MINPGVGYVKCCDYDVNTEFERQLINEYSFRPSDQIYMNKLTRQNEEMYVVADLSEFFSDHLSTSMGLRMRLYSATLSDRKSSSWEALRYQSVSKEYGRIKIMDIQSNRLRSGYGSILLSQIIELVPLVNSFIEDHNKQKVASAKDDPDLLDYYLNQKNHYILEPVRHICGELAPDSSVISIEDLKKFYRRNKFLNDDETGVYYRI